MEKNFNAIMYSDGKLWALPDWPEKPDPNVDFHSERNWDERVINYHRDCAASIKARVEFKLEQFYQTYGALSASVKTDVIKEGEVYPLPTGYRIDVTESCCNGYGSVLMCEQDCEAYISFHGKSNARKFALLLPIREESITLGKNSVYPSPEQTRDKLIKLMKDQPAKPEPTRKLVLDELIEWARANGFNTEDQAGVKFRKKEEETIADLDRQIEGLVNKYKWLLKQQDDKDLI